MGSSSQLYSLSWGEFSSSLVSSVQLLRGHGDLVDVTLAAGGRSFPAHKIVLCAASPFLLDLLKSTPCQHPVVMLAGIGADDLESLLEFVYRGEVSVEPSQLPSLLQAAHCLCIHGLTPPTILTENGEEIPLSAIPAVDGNVSKTTHNSYYPLKRRKKRRKSSSSSVKWACTSNTTDSESRPIDGHDNNRTMPYENKDDDTTDQTDDTAGNCVEYANNHQGGNYSPHTQESSVMDNHQAAGVCKDQAPDGEAHVNTISMQEYSPLHIPQFSGSMNLAYPPGLGQSVAASQSGALIGNREKTRGASDCPGDGLSKMRSLSDQPASCPLCGAILRQSRNLRRHLELLHFGLGNGSKPGVHPRHRRPDRANDFSLSSALACARPTARIDSHLARSSEASDFPMMTPLSITSSVSSASSVSLPGNLMAPNSSLLSSTDQNGHVLPGSASTTCGTSMVPPSNGIYSSDGGASMLSCLLPSLPTLPSFSASHDMFRHGEMLRAGIAYHDSSRQHVRHMQRTDVT